MSEEKKMTKKGPVSIERVFEQPPDAISFYCEMGQVFATENEMVMQFYETIPGPPDSAGNIPRVRTRLRATVTISFPHAKNIGKLLIEKTKKVPEK